MTDFTPVISIHVSRAPTLDEDETATLNGSVPAAAIEDPAALTVVRVPDDLSSAERLPTEVAGTTPDGESINVRATTTNFSTFVVGETQAATGEFVVDIDGSATDDLVEPGTTVTVVASVTNTGDSQATQPVALDFGESTSTDSAELTLNRSESETVTLTHDVAVDAPLGPANVTVRTTNDSDSTRVEVAEPGNDGPDPAVNVTASSVSPGNVTSDTQGMFEVAVRIDNTSLGDAASGDVTVAFDEFNLSVDDELAGSEGEFRIDYTDANVSNGTISVTEPVAGIAPSPPGTYPITVTDVAVATGNDTSEFLIEDANATIDAIEVVDGAAGDDEQPTQVDVDPDDLAGNGTEAEPYRIANASELQAMEDDLDANYTLVSDINAATTAEWNNGSGFDPVGPSYDRRFTGSFDGNNHTVTGLTIDRPDASNIGLFGATAGGATLSDVSLTNVNVSGGESNTGGLVGLFEDSTVRNASAAGSATGDENVGMLVGYNGGTITDASAAGNVTGSQEVGGFAGYNVGLIQRARASVSVDGTGFGNVGGLVGVNGGVDGGTIRNATASGSVTGDLRVGGLVGYNQDRGTLRETFAVGAVTGNEQAGGLFGNNLGTVEESYFDEQTTGQGTSARTATGLATAQMQGEAARTNM
ncbi:hypothetical protein EXE43_19510, partial [Halorubrum sp. SS5]